MEFTRFTAGKDDDGRRLDRICLRLMAGTSRGSVFSALRKSLVRLNGKKASPSAPVRQGDTIEIASFLTPGRAASAGNRVRTELPRILFRNEHILFLAKPAGLPVQPSAGSTGSVSELVRDFFPGQQDKGSLSFTPAPLHRLDRGTSGLLAVSQSLEGARTFRRLMDSQGLRKTYVGVAEGTVPKAAEWRDFLGADSPSGTFHTVRVTGGGSGSREAVTRAACLASSGRLSLAQYDIETGRKHQIRAQSAFHGFPLAGDTAYGGSPLPGAGRRFFLHAYRLAFPRDNGIGLPEEICCPLPQDFENFLRNNLLKWDGTLIL